MPRLVRVSFDYDDTLTQPEILEYAKELKGRGFNVWIVTARPIKAADDVIKTAKDLGISSNHVVFTNLEYKFRYIKEIMPIFHVDDNNTEIVLIKSGTKTVAIRHTYNPDWKEECERALSKFMDGDGFALTPSVQAQRRETKKNKYKK